MKRPMISRRHFLNSIALAGAVPWSMEGAAALGRFDAKRGKVFRAPPQGYRAEARRLTDLTQRTFWDARVRQYRAPVRSAETVDSDPMHNNGYVVWPALYALHALAAGAAHARGEYAPAVAGVVAGLDGYYDSKGFAYNAWLTYPGNNDKYYDDNAWAIVALVDAFEATGVAAYRDRAAEIMERFLLGGWDASGKPGGMTWGTDPTKANTSDRSACSTSGAALAAFRLAHVGIRRDFYTKWGRSALEWIVTRMRDKDDLVRDALRPPDYKTIDTKWTYNTGVPIHAFVEHYRLTKDRLSLDEARRMGAASIDRSKRLYDGLARDPANRYWYDSSFFVPYLADGLLKLYKATGDRALLAEVQRNANYAYACIRDPVDGLYFRGWRLWKIGDAQLAKWQEMTGQTHRLEADDSERASDPQSAKLAVAQRPLVKTLLANAAMARLYWLLAGV